MRLEKKEKYLDREKKKLIDNYAAQKVTQQEYVEQNIALDQESMKIKTRRAELLRKIPLLHKKEIVDFSIRQFCDGTKAGLEKCSDDDAKRKFLVEHIERVIYQRYKVTIIGSVPIRTLDSDQGGASKIPFKIEDQINTYILHRGPRQKFIEDGRLKAYGSGGRDVKLLQQFIESNKQLKKSLAQQDPAILAPHL